MGTKAKEADITITAQKKLNMNAGKGQINTFFFDEFSDRVIDFLGDCDDFSIEYRERGSGILIFSEKGSVSMKKLNEVYENSKKTDHDNPSLRTNRNYLVKAGEADKLLKIIGIMTKDGKVKNDMIRKYNQIDRFVELIEDMLKELCENKESITVLDCACGKSYLSFVLNYYIKEKLKKNCYFIGLDINEKVVEASEKMAKELGYNNMEFHAVDIKNYMPDRNVDLVISLHGCDIATDLALAAGVRYKAKGIVVIPCCHKELISQIEYEPLGEILKNGILKARFSDILTDGVRMMIMEAVGYETSIVEYISPLDTPKNLMIRSIKRKEKSSAALKEYKTLKDLFKIDPALGRYLYLD